MVLARNENDAARIKVLALHGMSKDAWKRFGDEGYKHYQVVECGYKYNMMDLQAAIGIHQLRRIEPYWKRREEIWNTYLRELSSLPVELPASPEGETRHAYHLFTLQVKKEKAGITRDQFLDAMTAHNIGVGVHYLSIPEHPYYQREFGWKPEDYPHAMNVGRTTVSIPLSAKLSAQDVGDVVTAIKIVLE
jgi:dTDP-4-amino-4,6-dideoxygalactose transaminase